MTEYVICTESTADLPRHYTLDHNLIVIPLCYSFQDDVVHSEDESANLKEFYNRMRANELPKTMASNIDTIREKLRPALSAGKDVLFISFSSGLSCSYNNAVLAANMLKEEFPERNILVVDSLSASLGQGFLVDAAVRKKEQGMGLTELKQWVEDNKLHVCHMFTVDDLKYLKNGGRISRTTAILGTLINVKPVLCTDDEGHLIPLLNVHGRKKALATLVDKMAETVGDYQNDHVFISHCDSIEDAQTVGRLVTERFGIRDIMYGEIGTTIGAHSGPGTIALFYFGRSRK